MILSSGHGGKTLAMFAVHAFEVMDKEFPLWFVLVRFLGVGAIGFLLCRTPTGPPSIFDTI